MKRRNILKKSAIYYVLLSCFMVFVVNSCTEDDTNILSDLEDLPTPTATSIEEAVGFGGAEATIVGTGFSTNPANNLITFGPSDHFGYLSVRAEGATSTQLTFTKPVISAIDATVFTEVRVSRLDDSNPERSNPLDVDFLPLISTYASDFVRARSIAFDAAGDGYVAEYDTDNLRIVKVTATGKEDYAFFSGTNLRGEIEFDSQGNLWVGTAWQLLHKIPPGGGDAPDSGVGAETCKSVSFDANDNLYISNTAIHRITPDGTETDLGLVDDWPGAVSTVADGYLYWWVKTEGPMPLQRAPITAEGVGAVETILEAEEGKYWPSTIVVDTDGNVYGAGGNNWGSDHATSIYKITPDGTESVVYDLGVSLWGLEFRGEYIYVTTDEDGRVLRCYMNGAIGAGR